MATVQPPLSTDEACHSPAQPRPTDNGAAAPFALVPKRVLAVVMAPVDDTDKLDDVADKTNEKLDEHPWAEWLPKAGWLARGFVYAFMGWTVLLISITVSMVWRLIDRNA